MTAELIVLQNLPVGIFEIMQGYIKYGSTFHVSDLLDHAYHILIDDAG